MTDIRMHSRRAPQPPIDASLVKPGVKFPKNRADYLGKPTVYDIVDHVETVTDASGTYEKVHYHNSGTGRKGSMAMRDFCAASEHRPPEPDLPPPEPEEPAPVSGVAPVLAVVSAEDMRRIEGKIDEVLAMLRARGPQQLSLLGGTK
jgi:hypothetical protein